MTALRASAAAIGLALLSACGGSADGDAATDAATDPAAAAFEQTAPAADSPSVAPAPASLAGRTRELSAPDDFTMVLLYYSVSGQAPPIDRWVENEVRYKAPADKAAAREELRAKIASALASLKDVGRLRLTVNAGLSEFDPTYSEFTVSAFAPSSTFAFKQFGEAVALGFDNGQAAQRWAVPQDQARATRDRIRFNNAVEADVVVQLSGASPSPDGGALRGNVVEYALRDTTSGTSIARLKVSADSASEAGG